MVQKINGLWISYGVSDRSVFVLTVEPLVSCNMRVTEQHLGVFRTVLAKTFGTEIAHRH